MLVESRNIWLFGVVIWLEGFSNDPGPLSLSKTLIPYSPIRDRGPSFLSETLALYPDRIREFVYSAVLTNSQYSCDYVLGRRRWGNSPNSRRCFSRIDTSRPWLSSDWLVRQLSGWSVYCLHTRHQYYYYGKRVVLYNIEQVRSQRGSFAPRPLQVRTEIPCGRH